MRKRVLSWILTISMSAAALMPAMPVSAAEYGSEAVSIEDSAAYAEEGSVEGTSYNGSEEAADETEEVTEGEKETVVEANSEDISPEGQEEASDTSEETVEPSSEDVTSEENSEEADPEALPEDVAPAESVIEEEEKAKELLGFGTDDPDIDENKIGFINNKDCQAVTVRSKKTKINVEIYVSVNEDKSDAELFATVPVNKAIGDYSGTMSETAEQQYYVANKVDMITGDKRIEKRGTFYIFARFITGEGDDGYEESDCIVYHNTPGPAPVIKTITPASKKESNNGTAAFEKGDPYYKKLNVEVYGSGEPVRYNIKPDSEAYADKLAPGRYAASFSGVGDGWFDKELRADSEWTEFTVGVDNSVEDIELRDYATLSTLPAPGDDPGYAELGKGSVMRVFAIVYPEDTADQGVIYESSDPKVVSVDANGNCKALKAPGEVTVTVTTKGEDKDGNPIKKEVRIRTVDTTPLKIKNAKFKESTVKAKYVSSGTLTLRIALDKDVKSQVVWSVEDKSVLGPVSGDYSTASDGQAEKEFFIAGPGKTTVTANIGGVKTINCTVMIEGSYDPVTTPYFYNGKFLTGFWAFDSTTGLPTASGSAALKKTGAAVRYYDPVLYRPLSGAICVGKKMYRTAKDDTNIIRGKTNKDGSALEGYIINKAGELQTGWQKADGTTQEYYYSLEDGKKVTGQWVPRGKGFTWVNSDGLMISSDSIGRPLSEDGIYAVDKDYYLFKGGIRQGGFAYVDNHNKITKQDKASWAYYFDPKTGKRFRGGFFFVGGKKYYADGEFAFVGRIMLNSRFAVGFDEGESGQYYYADKNGAIYQGGKLFTVKEGTFYADENGEIFFGKEKLINGKVYTFKDGYVDTSGEGVQSDKYFYQEGDLSKAPYVKPSNAKKPSAGTFLYKDPDCKQKLTSVWIYDSEKSYYLDNKGNFVTGPYNTDRGICFFDSDSYALSTHVSSDHVEVYKGKYYLVDRSGKVCTETGGFNRLEKDTYVRVKNNKGELMTGLQTIDKKKYFFTSDGKLTKPVNHIYGDLDSGKLFLVNTGGSYSDTDPGTWYIQTSGGMILYDNTSLVNKDGSVVVNGWGTVEGKKYYAFGTRLLGKDMGIVKIGGKYYSFDEDHAARRGWQLISDPRFVELSDYQSDLFRGEFFFFFDEKSGALQSGWKTTNALSVDSEGKVVKSYDGKPVVSANKKKLYLNAAASNALNIPYGALLRNVDLTVGGKIYRFAADGSVMSGREGFVYSDPKDSSIDSVTSYVRKDGTMARGRTLVNTDKIKGYFYFSQDTGRKETDVLRKCGSKWYYFGSNGMQSTTPVFRNSSENITGIFNSDGSLKGFVYNSTGFAVKNNVIICKESNEKYFIGENGLPGVGIVNVPLTDMQFYVEADGRNFCVYNNAPAADSREYRLVKAGSKYYMLRNGVVLNSQIARSWSEEDPNEQSYPEDGYITLRPGDGTEYLNVFSYLSDSDREEAERLFSFQSDIMGASHMLQILINCDGTAVSGKYSLRGMTVTCSRFGIIKDMCSPFIYDGGWKMNSMYRMYTATDSSIELDAADATAVMSKKFETDRTLRVSWDSSGKITSITDPATDKTVNGSFAIRMNDKCKPVLISVKNGKLSSGKITISSGGMSTTLKIDKEFGVTQSPYSD